METNKMKKPKQITKKKSWWWLWCKIFGHKVYVVCTVSTDLKEKGLHLGYKNDIIDLIQSK